MGRLFSILICGLLWLGVGTGNRVAAEDKPPPGKAEKAGADEPSEVAEDSPRASLQRFFEQVNQGRVAQASVMLDVPPASRDRGPELARRLKAVLDRKLWVDLESVSGHSEGDLEDGLTPRIEELGRIASQGGAGEPVRLVRAEVNGQPTWRFSRSTVGRIDVWYGALPDRWYMEQLPKPLLQVGPLDLMWWQWLALPALALLSALLGRILGWLSRKLLLRLASHTSFQWDNALIQGTRGPLALLWAIAVAALCLPKLLLLPPAEALASSVLQSGVIVALFWAVLRSIDLAGDMIIHSEAVQSPTARSMLPIAARLAKVGVLAMLVIAVLSNFGLPVGSLLAGLGVGGIALALAAQKTVENLFGAVSIGIDRPFRVGDLVKIGDFVGYVESIGLRSTRIRTADRTVITLPNGGLADSRIESFAERDRIRMLTLVTLEYGTSEATMRTVIAGIEGLFREDIRVFPDSIRVRFVAFSACSLDIEVTACLMTTDVNAFHAWREETLFAIMGIVERSGATFAFPTRTVQLALSLPKV